MLTRALLVATACLAFACSTSSTAACGAGVFDSVDASVDVVPADFTKVVVTVSNGGAPEETADSRCRFRDDTYTLDIASKALTWRLCRRAGTPDAGDLPFYDYSSGNKTLTDGELASVTGPIRAVRRVPEPRDCIADTNDEIITFTTSAGETVLKSGQHAWAGRPPSSRASTTSSMP